MIGFLVQMHAKPGEEEALEAALKATLPAIEEEPGTITWLAIRIAPSTYAVVDAFPDEAARQAHYEAGRVRMQNIQAVFAEVPTVVPTAIIAAKLPRLPDPQLEANKRTPGRRRPPRTAAGAAPARGPPAARRPTAPAVPR